MKYVGCRCNSCGRIVPPVDACMIRISSASSNARTHRSAVSLCPDCEAKVLGMLFPDEQPDPHTFTCGKCGGEFADSNRTFIVETLVTECGEEVTHKMTQMRLCPWCAEEWLVSKEVPNEVR